MQNYHMINVENKNPTRRRAVASGIFSANPETILRIKNAKLPKGDVLPLAECAGIMAAKNTSNTLPLCHPLALDSVAVSFEFTEKRIKVFCEAITTAKTGVEMEALNGAMAALLCMYDLTKGIDPVLEISEIHLNTKEGGKSGLWVHPKHQLSDSKNTIFAHEFSNLNASIITCSDRSSKGLAEDTSGPAIEDYFINNSGKVLSRKLISDSLDEIKNTIVLEIEKYNPNFIFTTGGTGIGPRDNTPEALKALGAKEIPGIGELIRQKSSAITDFSWISRAQGYTLKNTIIITLPGSKKAAVECMGFIKPILNHAHKILEGGSH